MNQIWELNLDILDSFLEIVEKVEKNVGQKLNVYEREQVFLEVMKQKGIKPIGHTELNNVEFIKEIVSKGQKIMNVDKDGITFIKKKEK